MNLVTVVFLLRKLRKFVRYYSRIHTARTVKYYSYTWMIAKTVYSCSYFAERKLILRRNFVLQIDEYFSSTVCHTTFEVSMNLLFFGDNYSIFASKVVKERKIHNQARRYVCTVWGPYVLPYTTGMVTTKL